MLSKAYCTVMYLHTQMAALMLSAAFAGIQVKTNCPGTTKSTGINSGCILSPNYPFNYENRNDCYWFLTSYEGNIKLLFEDFCTERCCDRVKVYNLNRDVKGNVNLTGKAASILGIFRGNIPVNTAANGTSRLLFITFKSDGSVIRRGFSLAYGFKLGGFRCTASFSEVARNARLVKIPNDYNTPTSIHNTNIPLYRISKIGYIPGPTWCSAMSDYSPYLQINLANVYIIFGASTQGDHQSNQWVQTYQIRTSIDGTSFTEYKENGISNKEFSGNFDSKTVVLNLLYEGVIAKHVRIFPESYYGYTRCMRTILYGVKQQSTYLSTNCFERSVMPSLLNRFTASSNEYNASNARPGSSKGWIPKTLTVGEWLQVDLGYVVYISAVATQGSNQDSMRYINEYKIRLSLDNIQWRFYKESNADKVFTANASKDSIVKNNLAVPTKGKFIRFYPTEFDQWREMRTDVYASALTCSEPVGLENSDGIEKIAILTSSSSLDISHDAVKARLYGDASWCSSYPSTSEFLQVNIGQMVRFSGIATQGDHKMEKWVKTFILKYSIDGRRWAYYRAGENAVKVFQGNDDKNTIVVRWLSHPITTRFVRVYPLSWNNGICMRIELFNCKPPSPPQIAELKNQNLTPSRGSYVELTCKVQDPLVKYIEWYSNGTNITSLSGGITKSPSFVKSVLRVNYTKAVDVFKEFQCVTKANIRVCRQSYWCEAKYEKTNSNPDSVKSVQVQVSIDTLPPLSSPIIQDIRDKSVKLGLAYPSSSPVKSVTIKYWNYKETKTLSVAYPPPYYTIQGLSVCTHYNLSMYAVSELGNGPWSNITKFRTEFELPNVVPSALFAQKITSQSILVSWKATAGVICSLDGYKVTVSTSQGGVHVREFFVSGVENTSYILTNLSDWTDFYISVRAHNEKGYGPPTTVTVSRLTKETSAQGKTLRYVSLVFNVIFIGIIIALLVYILYVRNRNAKENSIRKQGNAAYKNTQEASHDGIQMKDASILQTFEVMNQFQPRDLEDSDLAATEENYQALRVDNKQEGPVYENLNRRKKASDSDRQIGGAVYQQPSRTKESIKADEQIYANLYG